MFVKVGFTNASEMFPGRLLSLLERMVLDGATEEDRAEWLKEWNRPLAAEIADEEPTGIFAAMIQAGAAVDVEDARDIIRTQEQVAATNNEERKKALNMALRKRRNARMKAASA